MAEQKPQRYIAFLRAINVGGHTVKMETLRTLFEALGLLHVETFIASGNVIFAAPDEGLAGLETKIADHLRQNLGYEVVTFIRSDVELAAIAGYPAFPSEDVTSESGLYIAFLGTPPSDAGRQKLLAARTAIDDFVVHGREVHWLCRTRLSDSRFSGALLEKTIGQAATVRNVTTVRKLATKYAVGS